MSEATFIGVFLIVVATIGATVLIALVRTRRRLRSQEVEEEEKIAGIPVPLDRWYYKGHTWVKPEAGGCVTIGLDELGARLVGNPDHVHLPAPGTRLAVNNGAWRMKNVRVLSPVTGEVIDTGGPECGWYLKVKTETTDQRHLLRKADARQWMRGELDRLQMLLAGPVLADGGELVEDLRGAYPQANWDAICEEMFQAE